MKISQLDWKAKMFLAGCIKSAIMADGIFGDDELTELESLESELPFQDFPAALEKFEAMVKDSESFLEKAGEIKDKEVQELILSILRELSLREGFPNENELKLIGDLEKAWKL